MRFYSILIRRYLRTCEAAGTPCEHRWDCPHPESVPTEEWYPYSTENGRTLSVFDKPPRKQSVTNASGGNRTQYNPKDKTWHSLPPREVRVVYFDTEDMLDYTSDVQKAYEQKEAKMPVSYTHLTLPTNREV